MASAHQPTDKVGAVALKVTLSDAAPSPAQTDAAAWAAIAEAAARKRCAGARALSAWLRDTAHGAQTPKHDERTNVIDQDAKVTYALDRAALGTLFGHLEACRLEGTAAHFSERQGTVAEPHTGLMLDYDIVTRLRAPQLTDRLYYRFAGALAAALRGDFDVVLLDLSLPGFSGLEVARSLRASPDGARPYIVAMSGYSREEDVARATAAGCDTYLVKPVEFDRLERLLAARCDAATAARAG
jgi:CheY-like chemotaxis protein